MLDVLSFIEARGGNPELIRESQRRRYAPVEAVDDVIALYEEGRAGWADLLKYQSMGCD
jgi:seryl-tRNA synthetase